MPKKHNKPRKFNEIRRFFKRFKPTQEESTTNNQETDNQTNDLYDDSNDESSYKNRPQLVPQRRYVLHFEVTIKMYLGEEIQNNELNVSIYSQSFAIISKPDLEVQIRLLLERSFGYMVKSIFSDKIYFLAAYCDQLKGQH
jgi:hypothetical protein